MVAAILEENYAGEQILEYFSTAILEESCASFQSNNAILEYFSTAILDENKAQEQKESWPTAGPITGVACKTNSKHQHQPQNQHQHQYQHQHQHQSHQYVVTYPVAFTGLQDLNYWDEFTS